MQEKEMQNETQEGEPPLPELMEPIGGIQVTLTQPEAGEVEGKIGAPVNPEATTMPAEGNLTNSSVETGALAGEKNQEPSVVDWKSIIAPAQSEILQTCRDILYPIAGIAPRQQDKKKLRLPQRHAADSNLVSHGRSVKESVEAVSEPVNEKRKQFLGVTVRGGKEI